MSSRPTDRGPTGGLFSFDWTGPVIGGLVAALGLFGGAVLVGRVGDFEGLRLIEAMIDPAQFLSSAVIGAGATVLALMLTLLALTFSSEWRFSSTHFKRVGYVTRMATASIVMAVALLVFLSIPIEEVETLRNVYAQLYFVLVAAVAVLGGLVVATALMIAVTVRGLIQIAEPGEESPLLDDDQTLEDVSAPQHRG